MLFVPWLYRQLGERAVWWVALLPALLFVYFLGFVPQVTAGHSLLFYYDWIPSLGISLDIRLDGLSLLFALLITGIGTLVVVYAGSYLSGHVDQRKLVMYLCVIYGRYAWCRVSEQHYGDVCFLGTDQYYFIYADWFSS
ncbi:hypothetical protein ACT691_04100 [Vibrio metschnikovii]